ncbi:MAG TPA: hypothetical protein VFU47_11520 [Armatimonadota bacterium]|nr:hypothetical protein [Armatimonadota bacterium]
MVCLLALSTLAAGVAQLTSRPPAEPDTAARVQPVLPAPSPWVA